MTTDFTTPIFTQSLAGARPFIEDIPPEQVEDVQLDLFGAYITAVGVAPKVVALRARMVEEFGEAQASHVDRLEVAGRAAGRAQADYLIELEGADLTPLSDEVVAARAVLLAEGESLVYRGLLPAGALAQLRGIQGAKNQLTDLLQLVSVFRKHGPAIEGKTSVTPAELDRAEALANRLGEAVARREQAQAGTSPGAELRRRAYTHLVRTYDQVRRMVTYLRWEDGDADDVAPSLWAGRKRSRSELAPAVSPASPPTSNVAPGLPGAPALGPA